ncbi:MAG: hypothetical protein GY811_26320 [Myxococcales bacterium]|nr:hypothetical protein [Myxococcales bacterium]
MQEAAYESSLSSLFAARRSGIDFGLERMRVCLKDLALEHRPLATIQVAGTNGKGSTSALLANVLTRAGLRVGVFSSPHLLSICERFRINSAPVARETFVSAFDAVQTCAEQLTFFEYITAMAAWLFDEARVDVAIYEVGLGGRLDSTTAVDADLSIVTGIGLDHCDFLGDTLEEIALEKAGIFRCGVPAIIGLAAERKIRELMASRAERPVMVGRVHLEQIPEMLALRGAHQRLNAAAVVAAVVSLRERGIDISEEALKVGLETATLAGRLEEVVPGVWIDGAHNSQASLALSHALLEQEKLTMVIGLSNTKDIAGFLEPLRGHCARLIATCAEGERGYPAEQVASQAAQLGFSAIEVQPVAADAVARARTYGSAVLITGSLLLLGEVLSSLGRPGADPRLVTDPGKACC